MGSRMGTLTSEQPKCMTEIAEQETILSRQLNQLLDYGITEVVMTTGFFDTVLMDYCERLSLPVNITFVKNPYFERTNYIYSIYCAREYLDDDIILLHGDLVFENEVFHQIMESPNSCMAVSDTLELPEKDFKAVVENGKIVKIGIEYFADALAAQPLYKLFRSSWNIWLKKIVDYCESGNVQCYAEKAFNDVAELCDITPINVKHLLCNEIDCEEDLSLVSERVQELKDRIVYMCFSTDMVHSGHIQLIKRAKSYGKVLVGVLTDEAVISYKRFPLMPYEERRIMFENISGVYKVVGQNSLSYAENLRMYKPDYVIHGDDWISGIQKPIREEVIEVLGEWNGRLLEFPYSNGEKYEAIEKRTRLELALPDARRSRLKKILDMKGMVIAIEAHSGLTGLIAENTVVYEKGEAHQFDAMWLSSLCDSTAKGKPDIELVDMSSRYRTIDDILEVTTKPIIFDGDTGGLVEHFVYTVRTLERMGVSMIIIEDKTGLKKNSLFGKEVLQTQDTIEHFCEKIRAGKHAQKTRDFMICARIESLILECGMEDAISRAQSYVEAGADAIMIHSRKKEPSEIFEFVERFRKEDQSTPLVVVPTAFNTVTEEEFKRRGVNIVIYANQLTRTGFPAMQNAAKVILQHHRAKECDDICMPFQEIIRLIPEED